MSAHRTMWFRWPVLALAMKWLIPWNMLHIVPALSVVQNAASICLPFLIVARVVLTDSGRGANFGSPDGGSDLAQSAQADSNQSQ